MTLASLALFAFALGYFLTALPLRMGRAATPGPGLVPLVIGGLLLLCTAAHLVATLARSRARPSAGAAGPRGKDRRAIAGVLASTIVYPLVLEPLKFLVATAGVALVLLVLLRSGRPLVALFQAVGMAVVAFVVFARLLGVALPSGPLEHLLFQAGR